MPLPVWVVGRLHPRLCPTYGVTEHRVREACVVRVSGFGVSTPFSAIRTARGVFSVAVWDRGVVSLSAGDLCVSRKKSSPSVACSFPLYCGAGIVRRGQQLKA